MPDDPIEVPEADALDQRLDVGGADDEAGPPAIAPETPEADALDQSRTVPLDDGYESRA